MAHFAKVEDGIVKQVIVISNDDCNNLEFPESESKGQEYIKSIGLEGLWLQTSYNRNFRKNYAAEGYTYNSEIDAFISPKPYPSWILNKNTGIWEAPVPYPNSKEQFIWDEESKTWNSEPDYEVN